MNSSEVVIQSNRRDTRERTQIAIEENELQPTATPEKRPVDKPAEKSARYVPYEDNGEAAPEKGLSKPLFLTSDANEEHKASEAAEK